MRVDKSTSEPVSENLTQFPYPLGQTSWKLGREPRQSPPRNGRRQDRACAKMIFAHALKNIIHSITQISGNCISRNSASNIRDLRGNVHFYKKKKNNTCISPSFKNKYMTVIPLSICVFILMLQQE